MADPWITIENLKFRSRQIEAKLSDVNLKLTRGEGCLCICEHTSQTHSLATLLSSRSTPDGGLLIIDEASRTWSYGALVHRAKISILTASCIGHDHLSVAEQMFMEQQEEWRWWKKRSWKKHLSERLKHVGIETPISITMEQLSTSERKRLVLLSVLDRSPRCLVLRNFFEDLDEAFIPQMEEWIQGAQNSGMSTLQLESRLIPYPKNCTSLTLIKGGRTVLTGQRDRVDRLELLRYLHRPEHHHASIGDDTEIFSQLLKHNETLLLDLPSALILIDQEQRIQLVNRQTIHLFPEAESWSNQQQQAVFIHLHEGLSKWIEEDFEHRSPRSASFEIVRDQDVMSLSCRCFPIKDAMGYLGMMLMLDDNTEINELRQQASSAEMIASTGLLAAGVAHEINNPLEVSKNYLEHLQRRLPQEALRPILKGIDEELFQIRSIVGQLNELTTTNDQLGERPSQIFCLHETIQSTTKLLKQKLSQQGIQLTVQLETQSMEMSGSPVQARQILLNLIKNAMEAIEQHGDITIATQSFEKNDLSWIQIDISDSGPGLSPLHIKKVFQPFYSSKAHHKANMGLGLSITKRLVELWGGHISVTNTNEGCRFSVTLPRVPQQN